MAVLATLWLVACIFLQSTISEAAFTASSSKRPVVPIIRSTPSNLTTTTAVPTPASSASNAPTTENAVQNGINCPCSSVNTNTSGSNDLDSRFGNETMPVVNNEKIKRTVQEGILRFSLKFQHILSNSTDKHGSNVLFAPVNILAGLATLLLGSEAEAKTEILDLLEFYAGKDLTHKENIIHEVLGGLFANFSAEGEHNPAVRIKMNQAAFYQTGTILKEDFVNASKRFYHNELINLNYSSGDDESVKSINDWVSNHTEKRITEILQPPLPLDTKLILLNTLFFNGEWDEPFLENSTLHDFYPEKGPPIKVKTMSNSGMVYSYYNNTYNYSVIGLPYKGGKTLMYIILPDKGQKLKDVLSRITSQDLYDIMNSTRRDTDASYSLPYMQLADNIGLRPMLQRLGVRNIFDPLAANLSKIAENIGLFVSEALHNVNLDVTEAGSTGAASTTVVIENRFPGKKILVVNRPFSFFIIHRPSGVVSFWGTIHDPRQHN